MQFLRRISTRQLLALVSAFVGLTVCATALAIAATDNAPKPVPKPLATAVHDALTAPSTQGVSARVEFTNHLIDSSGIQGSDPLLSGASGRLWASSDGRLRLELQADISSGGSADVQVLVDRDHFTVYDSGTRTAYEGTLPNRQGGATGSDQPPSLAEVKAEIAKVTQRASLSGAIPSDVGGRPAYSVRVSPNGDGGMLGGVELAWDAAHGAPLRAAVYAKGDSSPVLELTATGVSFGPVASSVFDVTPPPGTRIVTLSPPARGSGSSPETPPVTGLGAVQQQTSFQVSAPPALAGLPQAEVRLVAGGKDAGALVTYGRGLGGLAVLELPSPASSPPGGAGDGQSGLSLPRVRINGGAEGQELATALGTAVRFQRNGVEYTVVGSVPPATALAAARGL